MLCYVMLCYVMLCYVMLCYVMLCYVMLCYVMLHYIILYSPSQPLLDVVFFGLIGIISLIFCTCDMLNLTNFRTRNIFIVLIQLKI